MKQFIKTATVMSITAVIMFACDGMNSLHEKYLDRGETIYLGIVDSIETYSGYHKIKFRWKINSDPRIDRTVIYWEKRTGSETVPVHRTSEGEMWVEAQLNNMEEGEYIFEFEVQDKAGNISKPVEISGAVLGDLYIENLRARSVKGITRLATGQTQITWDVVNIATLRYSCVEYTNTAGERVVREVPNDEEKTLLEGARTGDYLEIYAVHLPENAIESFHSSGIRLLVPRFERLIDKSRFAPAFQPGDNTTPQPGNSADAWKDTWAIGDNRDIWRLWDNNTGNGAVGGFKGILHTEDMSGQWENARFKFPHHFTFSIGTPALLTKFRLNCRSDAGSFSGHSPRYFELWATDEPKTRDDFTTDAAFELYYRTTYVSHKPVDNQIQTNPNGTSGRDGQVYIQVTPASGINNWQQDWEKLGDFEVVKPSKMDYNQRNDADNTTWKAGSDFDLIDAGKRVKYIRLVVKYPVWQHTNCINIGEVTFWGDDL